MKNLDLNDSERTQIAEILKRRANDIATFQSAVQRQMPPAVAEYEFPGSVEMALTREIERLRRLESRIRPEESASEDE